MSIEKALQTNKIVKLFRHVINLTKFSNILGIYKYRARERLASGTGRALFCENIVEKRLDLGLAHSHNAPFDNKNSKGDKRYEVRGLTKRTLCFAPSAHIGVGRKFKEEEYLNKLSLVEGFIVHKDVTSKKEDNFFVLDFYFIPSQLVLDLYQKTQKYKLSAKEAQKFIDNNYGSEESVILI